MMGMTRFIRMIWPILLGISLIFGGFVPETVIAQKTIVNLLASIFPDFFPPSLILTLDPLPIIPYLLWILAGFAFLYPISWRNYSKLIPCDLNFDASFDDAGLKKMVEALPNSMTRELEIPSNWLVQKAAYFASLQEMLNENGREKVDFTDQKHLSGPGHTQFKVSKDRWCQVYRMSKGTGNVKLSQSNTSVPVRTDFILMDFPDKNTFRISVCDILCKWGVYVSPDYEQTFSLQDGESPIPFGVLTVVTKINFFPHIVIEDSLYLTEGKDGFIPIGFCRYIDQ